MALTDKGRRFVQNIGIAAALIAAFFVLRYAAQRGYIGKTMAALVPKHIDKDALIDTTNGAQKPNVAQAPMPSSVPAALAGPKLPCEIWGWNANAGIILGVGGPATMKGSLAEKHGASVTLRRQDDTNKMQLDLLKFADAMSKGTAGSSDGVACVTIMGDGAAQFFASINPQLVKKYGADYRTEIVGISGYSHGEDKLMGPQTWKDNPQTMRGALIAGVIRDGDWNIALRYEQANDVPNNPDETTYDPNAVNWVNAEDFLDAPKKYIAGYCEDRPVVDAGKKTGAKKHVCVDGVVTWTPGDVNVAVEKGGLISVVSTRQWTLQMPCVIIVIHKFYQENAALVNGLLAATFEAADQINSYAAALHKAMQVSAVVYADKDAAYWEKYFKGTVEQDKQKIPVELGGSRVSNLADNLYAFGVGGGGLQTSPFRATYVTFGDIVVQQYPKLYPDYPAVDQVVNLAAVTAVQSTSTVTTSADVATYSGAATIGTVVARGSYTINFRTGSASFEPAALTVLDQLYNHLLIAKGEYVQINGHTDNVGSDVVNDRLSQERADAVKEWMEQRSPRDFPAGRLRAMGYGARNPRADNSTDAGRSQNRRVEIVIGEAGKK